LGGRIFFLFQNLLLKKVIKCTVLEVDEWQLISHKLHLQCYYC
jgi:hypothetical protein